MIGLSQPAHINGVIISPYHFFPALLDLSFMSMHELQSLDLRQWILSIRRGAELRFFRSSGLSEIFKFQISHALCDSEVQDCASSNWNMSLLKENSSQSMTLDTVSLPPR